MPEPKQRKASRLEVVKAVFWSFLGIRKRAAHESDLVRLKPAQVVIAGIVGALIFVLGLVMLARFIVSRAA